MWKMAAAGVTALFVTGCPLTYAQSSSVETHERLGAGEWNALTDLRIDLVKGALQLTAEQTKYWPTIEEAIRTRAKNRKARIENLAETVGQRADDSPMEVLRNRNPVNFLNRRAEALTQRSADLKRLADAWQPLYGTLSQEQKRRMAALTIFVLRDFADAAERRRFESEQND